MKNEHLDSAPTLDAYLEAAQALGWCKPLVLDVVDLAGGFDQVACDALEASEVIFTNSISSRPDLEENEPVTVDAFSILENTTYIQAMQPDKISAFMDKHIFVIREALKTHLDTISEDIVNEFFHLNYNLEYEDIKVFLNEDSDIDIDLKDVMAGIYYMILMIMCDIRGGMSALKLKELDFSSLKEITCLDVNIAIDGNAPKSKSRILNKDKHLQEIIDNNYIDIIYDNAHKKDRKVVWVGFVAKKHSYLATPIKLACNAIGMLSVSGDATVTADITNKKEDILLYCDDHSNSDIRIDAPKGLHLEVQNHARLVLSGKGRCVDWSVSDESMLFAARFVSDNIPIRCDDKSFVMVNSENFYNTASTLEVNATVVNTQAHSSPDYEAYRQKLRDNGMDDGEPDYEFHSKKTRVK